MGGGGREREDTRTTCTQIKGSMVEYKYSSVGICGMNVWCVCVRAYACACTHARVCVSVSPSALF